MIYDVIVIGSGIAGLCAAIKAKEQNLKVALVSKTSPLRSNSSMAAGGINAPFGLLEPDSNEHHIADTIKGGDGLSKESFVKLLCENAKDAVDYLESVGSNFDKFENGKYAQRAFGGAGKKRTCYVGDKTGGAIVQALMKKAKAVGVEFVLDHYLLNLLHENGKISGVSLLRKRDSLVVVYVAKAVVLAGGGYAGIYRSHTTNPQDTSGDLQAVAIRAGLRLIDMEMTQFHPTCFVGSGSLISEAIRGEGGYIVDENGERFVDELLPRDKLARAVYNKSLTSKVYIDARHLGEEVLNKKLPTFRKSALSTQGVDPLTEVVQIQPSAHYTMGGIEIDEETSTQIKGLYACGECAANLAHGANRLGGNSLLDAVVFGLLSGEKSAEYAKNAEFNNFDYKNVIKDMQLVNQILDNDTKYNINALKKSLGELLYKRVGLYRDEDGLNRAYDSITYFKGILTGVNCSLKNRDDNFELIAILEYRNALTVAEALTLAALNRKNSIGAHSRSDYPEKPKDSKHSYAEFRSGKIRVGFVGLSKKDRFISKIAKLIKGS